MSFLLPPIATWGQWAASFDDVRVWRPVVDAICEREGIAYDTIEAPASNTNAVFILDRRVVLKIYSPFWEECAFERRLMELLEHDAAVPVPAIRAAGELRDRRDWSYLAMEFCAGRPLDGLQAEMTQAALLEVAAQTGRMVRRLHEVDPEPLAAIDKGEGWDALVDRRRREVLPELLDRGLIVPGIVPELVARFAGRGGGGFANGRAGRRPRRSERRAPADRRARRTMERIGVDRLRRCPHRRARLRVDAALARSGAIATSR